MPPPPIRDAATEEIYQRFSRSGLWRRRIHSWTHGFTWRFLLGALSGLKRAVDFCAAFVLLLIFSPAFLFGRIQRTPKVGRWCEPFTEYSFASGARLIRGIPALINILKGDMSFVGPRPVSSGELSPVERAARKRYNARPGLVCLWWIRKRANIAYGSEAESDSEYVESQSPKGDIGIALRAIPALLYGEGVAVAPDMVTVLGITCHNLTMTEALDSIQQRLRHREKPSQVCFLNADCANIAHRNPDYRRVLDQAPVVLADGIGLKLAGKLLGAEIKQNVNGTDLFPRLCESLSGTGLGIFLLGARPGVVDAVSDWIRTHHPGTIVSGCHHGYYNADKEPGVIRHIADSGAALLLVAFGAPRQDLWIREHLRETRVAVAMGVGGLFDFYSGRIPRAPLWMREIGAEWLYRFYQEPRRMWRRYFVGNAVFLFRVMAQRRSATKSGSAR